MLARGMPAEPPLILRSLGGRTRGDSAMDVVELTIEVASRPEAGDILSSPHRFAEVTYLVSIGEAHDDLPAGYHNIHRKLRLLVADVVTELGARKGTYGRSSGWPRVSARAVARYSSTVKPE